MTRLLTRVVGFDDGPFEHSHRGDVLVVATIYSSLRLEAVLSGKARRDGANSTRTLVDMVSRSRFAGQLQAVFLQGIALAGFNVVDVHALSERLELPVIVWCAASSPIAMRSVVRCLLTCLAAHASGD